MALKIKGILFFLLCCGAWVSATERDFISIQEKGDSLVAGIFSKDSNKKAPVVIWFHGGMGSSRCNKGKEAGEGFLEFAPKALVVSPSACKKEHWLSEKALHRVDSILDITEKRRGIVIDSVSLVGVSDGALGVFVYSLYGKRKIKSRLLVSGFLKALGEPSDFKSFSSLKNGTWYFLQGAKDRLYPAEFTFPWNREFCKSNHKQCVLREDPNGEHDWSYWVKYRREWIMEFVGSF